MIYEELLHSKYPISGKNVYFIRVCKTATKIDFSRYQDWSICSDCEHKCVHYAKTFLKTYFVLSKCYSILDTIATGAQGQIVLTYWVALTSVQYAFTHSLEQGSSELNIYMVVFRAQAIPMPGSRRCASL